jgi:hypothetical protein
VFYIKKESSMKMFLRFAIVLSCTFFGVTPCLLAQSVSISASPTQITNEGQESTITLTISPPTARDLAVNLVATGTAPLGSEYVVIGDFNNSNQAVVPAGSSTVTLTLHSLSGGNSNLKEFAVLNVIAGRFYRVGRPSHAQVTIENVP